MGMTVLLYVTAFVTVFAAVFVTVFAGVVLCRTSMFQLLNQPVLTIDSHTHYNDDARHTSLLQWR